LRASATTLREVAADPRRLGAEIGVLSILHTWGQTLVAITACSPSTGNASRFTGRTTPTATRGGR
jgi:hypothetical protein